MEEHRRSEPGKGEAREGRVHSQRHDTSPPDAESPSKPDQLCPPQGRCKFTSQGIQLFSI